MSAPAPPLVDGGSPAVEWFTRLGVSGQFLLLGGAAGVIVAFFPLVSYSAKLIEFPGVMVIDDWRGLLTVIGYLAAIVLAVVLYPVGGGAQRKHTWAALGLGGVLILVGVWLFLTAVRASGGLFAGDTSASVGLGAILNLVTAGAVLTGAIWKAREERLV